MYLIYLFKSFILIIILLVIASCSSTRTVPDIAKNYYMDMYIVSGNASGVGTLVLPIQDTYNLKLYTGEKVDAIYMRTCSREIIKEDPRRGITRKDYTITYSPNEIEKSGVCPATIVAYNGKGFYSTALIEFEDTDTTLPATNICENLITKSKGVSVCQSRVSLLEKIKFDVEVMADPDKGCELMNTVGKEFMYQLKPGFCNITFVETKSPYRVHRLVTYGYDSIQDRE